MTIMDAAKRFEKMTLDQKMEGSKRLQAGITDKKYRTEAEKQQLERLVRWLTMNIMIGNELMPSEHLEVMS